MPTAVNGRYYSFTSTESNLILPSGSSLLIIAIDAISYSDNLEMADVPGASRAPVGVTAGVYKAEPTKLSIAKSVFQTGIVQAIGETGWMGKKVSFVVNYADEGEPISTDEIIGFLVGAADDHSAGPEHLKTELTIKTQVIVRNGIYPLGVGAHLL